MATIEEIKDFIEWYWVEIDGRPTRDSSLTIAEYYFNDLENKDGFHCPNCGYLWDTEKNNACQCGATIRNKKDEKERK